VAYFNLKDLDKAESNVRQALTLDPKARDAYTLLGNIDLTRGNIDSAKTAFRSAIQAEPNSLVNYLALENQYEREGNWDEAKNLCERAHQINPGSPVVAFRLARLYEDHGGDINVALSLAQVAKQSMPGFPGTADVLGWADYKLGASEAAIAQLKESVDKEPNNPIYQYHLGMAYLASGRSELARDSLRRALASDPSFPEAATARAALDKASKPAAAR
jgi:tetratricopeptide (TPR) repeat protein